MSTSICQFSGPDNCTTVCANTDVLGKGIRINFYCTMFLLALVPQTQHTEELLNALYANAGVAGLGLLLAAIIQTAQRQLSLFHAIFTLHILYFLGTGASPLGKYRWTKSRIAMGVFIQFASVVAFAGWGLFLWIHVDTYGSQPECNDRIKYVLLFFTVRVTAPWLRGLWIAALVLSAVGLMIQFAIQATFLLLMRSAAEEERAGETNVVTRHSTRTGSQSQAEETETDVPKPWYFSISYPLLLSSIYSTVMLELTVHRNEAKVLKNGTNVGPGVVEVDDSWVFGQVLAVVMIIANANEIVHFCFAFQARRNQRRRLARESEDQEEGTAHQAEGGSPAVEYRPRGVYGSSSSTCDAVPDKIASASEYELRNLENRKALLSAPAPTRGLSQDQPLGPLR